MITKFKIFEDILTYEPKLYDYVRIAYKGDIFKIVDINLSSRIVWLLNIEANMESGWYRFEKLIPLSDPLEIKELQIKIAANKYNL